MNKKSTITMILMCISIIALSIVGYKEYMNNKKDNQVTETKTKPDLIQILALSANTKMYIYKDQNDITIKLNNKEVQLSKALKEKDLSYEGLLSKMEFDNAWNDGGSKTYKSTDLFNKEFYLIECHSISGNSNIYIGEKSLTLDRCLDK